MKLARLAAGVAIVATGVMLTGCGPDAPAEAPPTNPPSAGAPSGSPTTVPAEQPAAAMPDLAGTEVLSVTATATAPNGAVLAVSLMTYLPVPVDSPEGEQIVAYLESVGSDAELDLAPTSVLQVSALEAVGANGNWPAGSGVLPAFGPGTDDTIIGVPAGPIVGSRLSITGAGRGWGVAVLTNQDGGAIDPAAWADRFTYYGFFDGFASASLSGCSIQLAPAGSAAAGVANWSQHNCYIGIGD